MGYLFGLRMLALVMSLIAATAPALPAASATCDDGPDSCELAPLEAAAPMHDTEQSQAAYATPAVIDCRSPVVPLVLSTLVGECIGTPQPQPHDASYRASRYPESEDSQSLTPATTRERRGGVASCDGLPQNAPALTVPYVHPIALFATPVVVHVATARRAPTDTFELPSRFRDPPDRPPRV